MSLSVEGRLPIYAGWFGTFWSAKRETAPVIHFGGSFTPRLLRAKEFTIGPGKRRLSLAFVNPGSGPGAESRLSIEALPLNVVPKVKVEWPTDSAGPRLVTSHELTERCCYWEFYTTSFEVPVRAVPGRAKVSTELPAAETAIMLATTEFEVPVTAEVAKSDRTR